MMNISVDVIEVNGIDANILPDQNSPQHILNSLDDFCIQTIFRNLTDLSDFVNASEACTRFQENAKQCFPLMFKTIDMADTSAYFSKRQSVSCWCTPLDKVLNKLSLEQQLSLLQNFGHLIYGIRYRLCWGEFYGVKNAENDNHLFKSIIEFCGQTLIELTVKTQSCYTILPLLPIDCFESQFPALKRIDLSSVKVLNLRLSSTLQDLRLCRINAKTFKTCIRPYPKLIKFEFHPSQYDDIERVEHHFLRFLDVNPQIIQLKVNKLLVSLMNIHTRIPNLERLVCEEFEGDLIAKTFKNLKYFTADVITDRNLIWLVTYIPTLESITVDSCDELSAEGIGIALQLAVNLKQLHLNDMCLEEEQYHSILISNKRRNKPCVVRVSDIEPFDISEDIVDENSKWIQIGSVDVCEENHW